MATKRRNVIVSVELAEIAKVGTTGVSPDFVEKIVHDYVSYKRLWNPETSRWRTDAAIRGVVGDVPEITEAQLMAAVKRHMKLAPNPYAVPKGDPGRFVADYKRRSFEETENPTARAIMYQLAANLYDEGLHVSDVVGYTGLKTQLPGRPVLEVVVNLDNHPAEFKDWPIDYRRQTDRAVAKSFAKIDSLDDRSDRAYDATARLSVRLTFRPPQIAAALKASEKAMRDMEAKPKK